MAILVVSAAYYLTYFRFTPNIVDEGLLVDSASRILRGQMMYRDFDHTYAPGRFYLMALLFKAFGEDFMVSRAMWIAVLSLNAALIFYISSRIMPLAFALLPALILLIVPGPWQKSFEVFLPLLHLAVLYKYLETSKARWLVALGVSSGIALVFRQDIGLHTIIITVAAIGAVELMTRRPGFVRRGVAGVLVYLGTISLLMLPVAAYFGDSIPYVLRSLFSKGSEQLSCFSVPYPSLSGAMREKGLIRWATFKTSLYYLPLIPYLALAIYLAARLLKREFEKRELFLSLALLFSVMLLGKLFIVPCFTHLTESIATSYLFISFFAYLLYRAAATHGRGVLSRAAAGMALAAILAFVAAYMYFNVFEMPSGVDNGTIAYKKEMKVLINSPNTKAYTIDETFNNVIKYIGSYTRPGDYIYVFPQSAIFYFMTGRQNPTRQDFNAPVLTDANAEADVIKSLKAKDVKLVIYDEIDTYVGVPRPPQQYYKNYAPRAYAYIMDNYSVVAREGRYRIMYRKGG